MRPRSFKGELVARERPVPGLEAFGSTHQQRSRFCFQEAKSTPRVLPDLIQDALVALPSASSKQMPQGGLNVGH